MKTPTEWIDRWLSVGVGRLHESKIPQYESDIVSMPYEEEVRSHLFFCYRRDSGLLYPTKQALPMIELLQVGI